MKSQNILGLQKYLSLKVLTKKVLHAIALFILNLCNLHLNISSFSKHLKLSWCNIVEIFCKYVKPWLPLYTRSMLHWKHRLYVITYNAWDTLGTISLHMMYFWHRLNWAGKQYNLKHTEASNNTDNRVQRKQRACDTNNTMQIRVRNTGNSESKVPNAPPRP